MKLRNLLAGAMAAALVFTALPRANAATSAEIREEIDALEAVYAESLVRLEEIELQQQENWADIEAMVAYKNSVDQEIFLLYSQMENLNQQITAYTALIAQTQAELDEAQRALEELNVRYRARVRAMEEEGSLSYWQVLFKAKDFTDLIDRLNMIKEIAAADERLMERMHQVTQAVAQTKETLMQEKQALEESRAALLASQQTLEAKREESDAILRQLNATQRDMDDLHAQHDAENQALADEIAQAEKAYNEAVRAEEEERRRQEEEERRRQEEEEAKRREEEEKNNPTDPTDPADPTEPDEPEDPPTNSDSGWLIPCAYIMISSPYGQRGSGWHNGVDFANDRGTPIYATRSGTVTKVKSMTTSYGNHVVVNHGDGFSSLYAHLDYYVVSEGQYVQQGQLLGYMGSTGNSTGNHLHFTIFYNGSDVNPMNYL